MRLDDQPIAYMRRKLLIKTDKAELFRYENKTRILTSYNDIKCLYDHIMLSSGDLDIWSFDLKI